MLHTGVYVQMLHYIVLTLLHSNSIPGPTELCAKNIAIIIIMDRKKINHQKMCADDAFNIGRIIIQIFISDLFHFNLQAEPHAVSLPRTWSWCLTKSEAKSEHLFISAWHVYKPRVEREHEASNERRRSLTHFQKSHRRTMTMTRRIKTRNWTIEKKIF